MALFFDISTGESQDFNLLSRSEKLQQRTIVPLHIPTSLLFIEKYIETLKAGNIPFILNPQIPKDNVSNFIPRELKIESSLGHILCTSGTTSKTTKIKKYFFKLEKAFGNAKAHNESLKLNKEANIMFTLPFTHSFGTVVGLLGQLELGGKCYFSSVPIGVFEIFENLENIDVLYLTPPQVRQINKYAPRYKGKLFNPGKISIGSSILFENEAFSLQQIFPESEIFYTYGLTEMGPRVSTNRLTKLKNQNRALSIGQALNGVELFEKEGCLFTNSRYASESVEIPFNTNDCVESVDRDYLIRGRKDDVVIYQGKNIYPDEIEALLINSGLTQECAFVGIPSNLYGEIPILVIRENEGENKIWDLLKKNLPESHLPKRIVMEGIIERTELGKIKRKQIVMKYREIL